jgi:hypothetical protein
MAIKIFDHIKSWINITASEEIRLNNIVITGVPRSGTTLCCYLLSQVPNMVALNEPLNLRKFKTKRRAIRGIENFYAHTRHTLLTEGFATARATKDGLTDNNFAVVAGKRDLVVKKRQVKIDKPLDANFYLALKHNALFTIMVSQLQELYPTYAIVRNPLSILGSWNSVEIPVTRGEVRAAQWLAPQLTEQLEEIPDIYDKQLHILNWYFNQYLSLPKDNVLKYEEIIRSNGHALKVIHPKAIHLNKPLESKNKSNLYNKDLMKKLADKLLKTDHAYWSFYNRSDVENIF